MVFVVNGLVSDVIEGAFAVPFHPGVMLNVRTSNELAVLSVERMGDKDELDCVVSPVTQN